MNQDKYITEDWRKQGLTLTEPDDHILELRKDGNVIAGFSQTQVTIQNILKVARKHLQSHRN